METNKSETVVVDIRMPFWSMVVFMVKWAIAAIPALIILFVIGALLVAAFGGFASVYRFGAAPSATYSTPRAEKPVSPGWVAHPTAPELECKPGNPNDCRLREESRNPR